MFSLNSVNYKILIEHNRNILRLNHWVNLIFVAQKFLIEYFEMKAMVVPGLSLFCMIIYSTATRQSSLDILQLSTSFTAYLVQ